MFPVSFIHHIIPDLHSELFFFPQNKNVTRANETFMSAENFLEDWDKGIKRAKHLHCYKKNDSTFSIRLP